MNRARRRKQNAKALSGNAAQAPSKPELGQRTPQPNIRRLVRKPFGDLELASILSILRQAEDGNVENLADLWLRMLKTDAHLASVWETRMAPVFSARWEVGPGPTSKDDERAQLAADACREALLNIPDLPTVFSALLNARGVGYAVAEIIWKRGTLLGLPAFVPVAIKPIHSRRFRFAESFEIGLYDGGRAVAELQQAGISFERIPDSSAPIVRLPAGKYIVHQPVGIADYPTATGLVHSLARPYWVKQVATKLWLTGAETAANARFIGHVSEHATEAVMDDFLDGLETLAADGVIVLRPQTKLEIVEGKANNSAEVWKDLIESLDAAISKNVLGSTLNVDGGTGGGNRALGESQAATTIRPRQQQDAAQMWSSIQRCLFRFIIEYNPHIFGVSCPLPYGRSVLVEERSEIDQLAVDSGAVKVDELRQSRGLTLLGGELGNSFIAPITRAPQAALVGANEPASTDSPSKPEEALQAPSTAQEPAADKVADEALNGAQIQSLQGIIQSVAAGQLPPTAATELISVGFPTFSRESIERMVSAAANFTPTPKQESASLRP